MPACRCQFCAAPLEPVQEFRYLVETATDDPVHLNRIRALPHAAGRPLRVCKGCQAAIRVHPERFRRAMLRPDVPAGVLAAGLLSLGLFVVTLVGEM
ncbi:MAG: hypothetical protein U0804_21000 [Gemmataceae bacterium]